MSQRSQDGVFAFAVAVAHPLMLCVSHRFTRMCVDATALLHLLCNTKNVPMLSELLESRWSSALDFASCNNEGDTCIDYSTAHVSKRSGDEEQREFHDLLQVSG